MTLSPEEREKIYEEEKARKEAQERLKQEEATAKKEVDKKNARRVGIGCLSIIGLLLIVGVIGNLTKSKRPHPLLATSSLSCAPNPDEDDSTLGDTPRPLIPTRILRWHPSQTQVVFVYISKTGEWQFLAAQDSSSKRPISVAQAKARLCQ